MSYSMTRARTAFLIVVGSLATLWIIQIINNADHYQLSIDYSIQPRIADGLCRTSLRHRSSTGRGRTSKGTRSRSSFWVSWRRTGTAFPSSLVSLPSSSLRAASPSG